MRALVLAAGWATRLGALATDRPKHLLPVGRTTPLDRVVERLDAVETVARIDVDEESKQLRVEMKEATSEAKKEVGGGGRGGEKCGGDGHGGGKKGQQ